VSTQTFNVLFICSGNSARSILAEALLNHISDGLLLSHQSQASFRAYSAGVTPLGEVNPHVLALLQRHKIPIDNLRSKSWDEFARPDSVQMDFVFTVCDQAAQQQCPTWPGQPLAAHWSLEDPASASDVEKQKKLIMNAFLQLHRRLDIFTNLPIDTLDRISLKRKLDDIGDAQE